MSRERLSSEQFVRAYMEIYGVDGTISDLSDKVGIAKQTISVNRLRLKRASKPLTN